MFPVAIANALRAEGYDVIAVQEDSQLRELSDPALFAAAQHLHCSIVTENVKDYLPLDTQSHAQAEAHWGLDSRPTNRSHAITTASSAR